MTKKDLMRLKDQIEDAKQDHSRLSGKQEYLLKELKTKYNCSSIEEANKLAKDLSEKRTKLEDQIQKGLEKLEEQYEL